MPLKVIFITDNDDYDSIIDNVSRFVGGYDIEIEKIEESKPHEGGGPKPIKKWVGE